MAFSVPFRAQSGPDPNPRIGSGVGGQVTNAATSGGAVFVKRGIASFSECSFVSNSSMVLGGAVYTDYGEYSSFFRCRFEGNSSANGGALYFNVYAEADIRKCQFLRNSATASGAVRTMSSRGLIQDCLFESNEASSGGALGMYNSPMLVSRSVFDRNRADAAGGAIAASAESAPEVEACTFVMNSAPHGGGLQMEVLSSLTIVCSVIASAAEGEAVYCSGGSAPQISCSDLHGNAGGDWVDCVAGQADMNGNFSADPLFCDPDAGLYTIQSDSPCAPPGVTGCGLVGAVPVGCGPVSVNAMSWGKMKGAYR